MKDQADKHIDALTRKMMKETSLESPAFDFTDTVMAQVESLKQSSVTVYKPLISKAMWAVLGFGFVAVLVYIILGTATKETSWLSHLDFSILDFSIVTNNKFTQAASGITISKTLMYAITFLGIMICVQVSFLKNYFDKRLEV